MSYYVQMLELIKPLGLESLVNTTKKCARFFCWFFFSFTKKATSLSTKISYLLSKINKLRSRQSVIVLILYYKITSKSNGRSNAVKQLISIF